MNLTDKIATIVLPKNIKISGYVGEYVFERIRKESSFYEQHILEKWFKDNEGLIIYDIGANIGNHTVYFASLDKSAEIYAFEPVPENFYMLQRNIANNDIGDRTHLFPFAVGNKTDMVYMSLNHTQNYGSATVVTNSTDDSLYKVKSVVIDQMHLPSPNFIKIYVEGFELNVLEGMKDTLSKMNSGFVWIEIGKANAADVFDIMSECGFFVLDVDLSVDNNIIFIKTQNISNSFSNVFIQLLDEASRKRKLWIDRSEITLQFQEEQKMRLDALKQLEKEQGINTDTAKLLKKEQETNKNISENLNSSIKRYNDLRKDVQKMQAELNMFRNSKMIKIMRLLVWKAPKIIKVRSKAFIRKCIYTTYLKMGKYPNSETLS